MTRINHFKRCIINQKINILDIETIIERVPDSGKKFSFRSFIKKSNDIITIKHYSVKI